MSGFMKKHLFILILISTQAHAQISFNGEWKPPIDAKSYCVNLEQLIVSTYKNMLENNRLLSQPNWTGDRRTVMEMGDGLKKALIEKEESWNRMGCVSILYAKK
jgi:hypothetical protein